LTTVDKPGVGAKRSIDQTKLEDRQRDQPTCRRLEVHDDDEEEDEKRRKERRVRRRGEEEEEKKMKKKREVRTPY